MYVPVLGGGGHVGSGSTSSILLFFPSFTTSVPSNAFIMVNPPLSLGVALGGNVFFGMGPPSSIFPFSRGYVTPPLSRENVSHQIGILVTLLFPLKGFSLCNYLYTLT